MQIISAIVDVEFESGILPKINSALKCDNGGKEMSEYERGIYDTFSDDPRLNETYSDAR